MYDEQEAAVRDLGEWLERWVRGKKGLVLISIAVFLKGVSDSM